MNGPEFVRLVVFALAYVGISAGRIPGRYLSRPAVATAGAVAMILLGRLPIGEAAASIDVAVAGFLSALFVNDTVCLVLTPLVLAVVEPLGTPAVPYLVALATASNVGSVMTPTGNPQNMLVAVQGGFHFGAFVARMAPAGLGGLVLTFAVLTLVFRKELAQPFRRAAAPAPVASPRWGQAGRVLAVFGATVAAWLAGAPVAGVAIGAGVLALLAAPRRAAHAVRGVAWRLLLFFAGLFILVRGIEDTTLVANVMDAARVHLAQPGLARTATVAGTTLVLSNVVSNVPAVMIWLPIVPQLPDPSHLWLVIAMSATFAGNLVLVGSMANLIVAERAAARGTRLPFLAYARAGVPITLVTVAWGALALVLTR